MISRRRFIVLTSLAATTAPLASLSQSHKKISRVGYLSLSTPDRDKEWLDAFRQGLKELGYIEGSNIVIEARHADGYPERLDKLAAELVQRKVDVVLTYGRPAVRATQAASSTIPIIMTVSADPVEQGLAKSMSRPGGQVTGFSDLNSQLASKRLQMLKEILPPVTKVAVIINPAEKQLQRVLDDLKTAAVSMGITLVIVPLTTASADEFKQSHAPIARERPDALMVIPDGTSDRVRIAKFALDQRLPSIGTVKEWAEAGFLISYGTSFADLWRRSASYVDKILKGAKPGDLPIEQPTKFEVVLNMKTANALGIKIPKSILVRADKVIE